MGDERIRRDIAARLKQARRDRAHSQRDFAAAIGMPLPSYRDYEGGKRIPGGEALQRLARAGIDAHWLLTGEAGAPSGHGALAIAEPRGDYDARSGSRETALDRLAERLREIITAVETGLAELGHRLPPARKAELVTALYELYDETGKPPSGTAVKRLIRSTLKR